MLTQGCGHQQESLQDPSDAAFNPRTTTQVFPMNRDGEIGPLPTRLSRFYEKHTYWYYRTREGIDIGPFDSLMDAERGAAAFIDYVVNQNPSFTQVLIHYKSAA
jgi:Domain of unknown function (DUF6316)